jgi:hypothetical protein
MCSELTRLQLSSIRLTFSHKRPMAIPGCFRHMTRSAYTQKEGKLVTVSYGSILYMLYPQCKLLHLPSSNDSITPHLSQSHTRTGMMLGHG